MKTLNYFITIHANREMVWNTMLRSETYKEWAKAFSDESQYEGEWKEGNFVNFFDPNMGGTKALLEVVVPHYHICARHVAILSKDGTEDTEGEIAKKWIGVTEAYQLNENQGVTELTIEIKTHEDFEQMFNDSWPGALNLLKEICERS